jgi:acetyl-CoA C-acetyltransferase
LADKVGIVGVGFEGFRPIIPDLSTRELMYEAASRAYADAGVDPRKDVDSFICCTEDLWEGWSITDEMVPDQVGGARRPVCTVPADGITGVGHAVMQIRSGVADVVAVEAHSKAADVLDKVAVENLALDPVYLRTAGVNYDALAGLEMDMFLRASGLTREDCSDVVSASKRKGFRNGRASYCGDFTPEEVSDSEPLALPLREMDKAQFAEGGVVLVLASERWIRKNRKDPVYLDGVAWRSGTPWFEGGTVAFASYAKEAFAAAKKQAGAKGGLSSFDVVEADDTYSYKLVQHLISLGLDPRSAVGLLRSKNSAVNNGGGSLAVGCLLEASGLNSLAECVLQLRGTAGAYQVRGAEKALALSWRGHPTASGAVAILSR